jgi:carbon storage regulator
MLILTRKPGESIMIGDNVEITILAGNSNSRYNGPVRVGISAPQAISVHRLEIYEKIKSQQQELKRGKIFINDDLHEND